MDAAAVNEYVSRAWTDDVLPALDAYIRIPNVSPAYAPDWAAAGHMAAAASLIRDWIAARDVPGASVEVVELPGRTPIILVDVPGASDDTVLLYGHLDKQPPLTGWRDGLDPWVPVLEGDRLYGRGGADDGYAVFAALTAIEAVRAAGGAHARCVVLIEASEESGSPDLPAYIEHLGDRIGTPSLVVSLDSGCATYDRLWVTTSLRGNVVVSTDRRGAHRGDAQRQGGRHRPVVVPHPAAPAEPDRGRPRRRDAAAGAVRRHPARPRGSGAGDGRRARPGARRRVPDAAVGRAARGDPGRAVAQPVVAAGAGDRRHGRRAADRRGRQRAAAVHPRDAVDPDCRRRATPNAPRPPYATHCSTTRPPVRSSPRT